jgi:hypothetical protein
MKDYAHDFLIMDVCGYQRRNATHFLKEFLDTQTLFSAYTFFFFFTFEIHVFIYIL